jgi:hypothetical protein
LPPRAEKSIACETKTGNLANRVIQIFRISIQRFLAGVGGAMSQFNESFAARPGARMRSVAVTGFCLFLFLMMPVAAMAQGKARWISSTQLITNDGLATLRWSVDGIEAIALFRLREEHSGEYQISYTDQAEILVVRGEPGDYSFWVQACKRYADGYPQCGESSRRLILSVIEADDDALASAKATNDSSIAENSR